jgi:hypothetical protein
MARMAPSTAALLHHLDLGAGGFEVVAAGIEGEALADQHQAALHRARGPVGEVDEFRRQVGALGHRQVGAHAQGFAVAPLQNLQLQAVVAGDGGGGVGQGCGGHHVGRGRHQLPRQFHAAADGVGGGHRRLGRLAEAQQVHLAGAGPRLGVAFEALIHEQAEAHRFGHGRGGGIGGKAFHRHRQPQLAAAGCRRRFAGGGGGTAQLLGSEIGGGPKPHQDQLAGGLAQQVEADALAGFGLEAPPLQLVGHGGPKAGHQGAAAGGTGFVAKQPHRQRFTAPGGQGGGAATDLGGHLGGSAGGDGRRISRARR